MNRKHKITISEQCHEDWNKMTPSENGRFCLSCSKTVIDFTSMLPQEIQHFFIQNKKNNVCGRFRKSQLDTVTIQIPNRILYAQTNYYKMFLLALFVTMGTTLFSCQDKNGSKQKIDKIEVTNDHKLNENIVKGKTLRTDKNVPPPPPPPQKVDQVKFVKPKSVKDEETKSTTKTIEEPVYNGGTAIETNAEFPGGIEQFYSFFEKEYKNPENINLKINLSFAVEKNGSVSYLQCVPAVDNAIEQEIIRVLSACPKWQPGEINGKKIKRQYSLPITIK
ncbi:hypothetical protein AR687_04360 [Flavobacteriaceae bacterium CRH]|nr:hypothetical protein AR687_04360 [Flavobacteriaceae bacterium CRH]